MSFKEENEIVNIKICGIRTIKDIEIINKYYIQYAGFIFAKGSKRQLSIEEAKNLRKELKKDIKAVGVFTYTSIDEVNTIADYCNLDIVQLHSNETVEDCSRANRKVWKSISVKLDEMIDIEKYKQVDGILFDTYKQNTLGGSGEVFNWDKVKGLSQKYFIILAGGLNENNIVEAINIVKPQVVDICSGVETNGFKDEIKIKNIVRRVRNEI